MRPIVLAAALLLSSSTARAQDAQGHTFSLQLFRPALDGKGFFTLNASQLLGHLDYSIGLVANYAHDVLELHTADASFRVRDLVTADLQATLGLFRWAELGVSLPVHILFGARGPSYVSSTSPNLSSDLTFGAQMVGDLGFHGKVRLLHPSKFPVGLALLTSLYVPTGDSNHFLGEGNVSLRPELILDKEFGATRRIRLALNAGALVRFDRNTFTDRGTTLNVPGSHIDPAAHGGDPFCFPAPSLTMAPGTCGTGQSRTVGTQLTYGLGFSGAVVPGRFDLLAELYGYADVSGSADAHPLEWLAGGKVYLASRSYFEFGAGTGIIPGQTGSPDARAFIGFLFEPLVRDRDDEKPVEPVAPTPRPPPLCSDGEPEGCAQQPLDHDAEPVHDTPQPCPDGEVHPEGCPDMTRVKLRHGVLQIFDKIYFETAKAIIRPESFPTLNAVAAMIKLQPQLKLVEVQGHADERGDDDYNMQLTETRAQAVKQYLIEHGVASDRLYAHGYGETRPVCREHGPSCWSQNRRVEFIIVVQEGDIPGQD